MIGEILQKKGIIMDKKLLDFLITAKRATYAGKGAETAPSREKSHF